MDKDAWEARCLQAEADRGAQLLHVSDLETVNERISSLEKENEQLRRGFLKRGAQISELETTIAELEQTMDDMKDTHAAELFALEEDLGGSEEEKHP